MAKSLNVLIGATLDSNVTKNLNAELEKLNLNKVEIQLGFDEKSVDGIKTAIKQSLTSAFNGISFVENEAKDIGQAIGENIAKGMQASKKQIKRHLDDVVKETDKAAEKITKKFTRAYTVGSDGELGKEIGRVIETDYGNGRKSIYSEKEVKGNLVKKYTTVDDTEKIAAREAEKADKERLAIQKEVIELRDKAAEKIQKENKYMKENYVLSEKQKKEADDRQRVINGMAAAISKENVSAEKLLEYRERITSEINNSENAVRQLEKTQASQPAIRQAKKEYEDLGNQISVLIERTKLLDDSDPGKTGIVDYLKTQQKELAKLEKSMNEATVGTIKFSNAQQKAAKLSGNVDLTSKWLDKYTQMQNDLNRQVISLKSKYGTQFNEKEYRTIYDINEKILTLLKKQDVTWDDIEREIKQCQNAAKTFTTNLGASAKEIKEIRKEADLLDSSLGRFIQFYGFGQLFGGMKRAFKDIVTNLKEIDDSMLELKKVGEETDYVYDRFLENAADKAKALGTTLKDYIDSVTEFARMGYDFKESQTIAETANIMQMVSEGLTGEESAQYLISIMAAYGIEAENTMKIIDQLNNVDRRSRLETSGQTLSFYRETSRNGRPIPRIRLFYVMCA